jgi:hypothetical protein
VNRVAFPSQIPGLAEIEQKTWLVRTVSFQPIPERIGQFTVMPMTLRHYATLRIVASPFLPPFSTPTKLDLSIFLWVLNPKFTVAKSMGKRLHFYRCGQLFKKLATEVIHVYEAREYINEALIDRPPSTGRARLEPNYFSDECSIIATLAREYGWSEAAIQDIPLKRIFQYLKEISAHYQAINGKKPILYNPEDKLKSDYLEAINRN